MQQLGYKWLPKANVTQLPVQQLGYKSFGVAHPLTRTTTTLLDPCGYTRARSTLRKCQPASHVGFVMQMWAFRGHVAAA